VKALEAGYESYQTHSPEESLECNRFRMLLSKGKITQDLERYPMIRGNSCGT